MQPPYQYPKTTKYPSSQEPTQAAYSSNYETTEQVHLNPYLNNPYELPSLPPPPPPPPQSRKGLIMVVIALLCLIIVSTSLFVGYVFIRPEIVRQTKVTATPAETPADTPSPAPDYYVANDIINAFIQVHLPIYNSSHETGIPIQAPYDTGDVMFFQADPGYAEWYLAVFSDDAQAQADADYVNSNPDMFVSYSKHRCLLLSPTGLNKETAPYWDVMNTACT